MSLIVQASRKANEYSLSHKENKLFNRSIEALKFNDLSSAARLNPNSIVGGGGGGASSTVSGVDSSDSVSHHHHHHHHHHHVTSPLSAQDPIDGLSAATTTKSNNLSPTGVEQRESFEEYETRRASERKKRLAARPYSIKIITAIIKLAFSNIGLIAVVFIYSTVGALMFQLLEQHEELRLCEGQII